ncbi:MAG: HAD-IA family hydrolase [Nitrospirae bacterium]|nr:HAD-IA family hydrolase [Nitrospirota bacterium]
MTAAALFDLDDTLYRETDYVESGFRAVAGFISSHYGIDEDIVLQEAIEILKGFGRGKVFDILLERLHIFDKETIRYLIYIYRTHEPAISVYPEVIPILEQLRASGVKTGLITDGMAVVQKHKVSALGIARLFDVIIYTDAIGREFWKPSPVPFKMALKMLGVPASDCVYIGDDSSKDFFAPNVLGMKSVQIKREPGINKPAPKVKLYSAQKIINNLSEYFGDDV